MVEERPEDFDPFQNPWGARRNRMQRRRDRIVEQVLANRRGEYRVPTWVLATVLGVIVVGYAVLLIIS